TGAAEPEPGGLYGYPWNAGFGKKDACGLTDDGELVVTLSMGHIAFFRAATGELVHDDVVPIAGAGASPLAVVPGRHEAFALVDKALWRFSETHPPEKLFNGTEGFLGAVSGDGKLVAFFVQSEKGAAPAVVIMDVDARKARR